MSTKIYNAFIFPKKMSINALTDAVLGQKEAVRAEAMKLYFTMLVKQFVYYYDKCSVLSEQEIREKQDKLRKKADEVILPREKARYNDSAEIYESILAKDYISAFFYCDKVFEAEMELHSLYEGIFEAKICIIPCGRKLLAMAFGNHRLWGKVVDALGLQDYHYQNQTNRPEGISSDVWNRRCKTWDEAIGPDYIPSNHGFTFSLVSKDEISLIDIRLHDRSSEEPIVTKENILAAMPLLANRTAEASEEAKGLIENNNVFEALCKANGLF